MKGFLYGQTEYNILASASRINEYIDRAKNANFDYVSITDKAMYGVYKFYKLAKEKGIKPVIGLEYSFNFGNVNKSKVLLYAKNNKGFNNLLKISTLVETKGIDTLDNIKEYVDDLFLVFVFNNSILEELLISQEYNMLNDLLNIIKSYNGFIGISNTNYPFKEGINNQIRQYVNDLNIDIVPIHKSNYLNKEDYKIYETLRMIDGVREEVGINDFSFIDNPVSDSIIDRMVNEIDLSLYDIKPTLPKFPNTKNLKSNEYLKVLCEKGLSRRLSINHINTKYHNMYFDRLHYELDVISRMGYDDYFLIVWDFIRYSKQNDILVGPGRGSAAGSLVAYSLGITEVDPLRYGLFFERFLNPERISMPDIDTDFPDDKRDTVIKYVKELYGKYHVCSISTFGTFKLRSSIKDLARILSYEESKVKKIVDMVEKYSFDYLIKEYDGRDIELVEFLKIARGLEDLPRHISTHAAGIIISGESLDDLVPLINGDNDLYQSQYEFKDLEEIGLLKMDFLSLSNLSMIYGMMKDSGVSVSELRNIPLDDAKVYKMLSDGDTLGLFQLESRGIKDVLRKLKPTCFMDLVATLALYRPGPMDYIPDFINAKHGGKINYPHPDLEPILKETYGVIVYQEQIMQIAQKIAGFSLGEADLLRRAISKKDSSKLEALQKDFISRSIKQGYDNDTATKIYDLIFKFANYGFNKSHSVAYAYVTYQMAYFKVNYFPVFMGNILNNVISQAETLSSYIKYAKLRGLKVHKPNINISTNKFTITKEGLFIPFTAIKSIATQVTNKLLEARDKPFTSYDDFRDRTSFLTSENNTALIFTGCLDMFGKTKKSMCENTNSTDVTFFKHMNIKDSNDEYDEDYLARMEKIYLGFNLEYSIYRNYEELVKKYKIFELDKIPYGRPIGTLVAFKSFSKKNTKAKGEAMAVGVIENDNVSYRCVMFPKDLTRLRIDIELDKLYIVNGTLKDDNKKEKNFIIDDIFEIKN